MTPRQKVAKTSLIKQVHTSQRYRNYYRDNRDEYEALLQNSFGKKSSKALSVGELIMLVDYLNMKRSSLPEFEQAKASAPQLYKIEQLWSAKARDKSTAALLGFVERITSKRLNVLSDLGKGEAAKLIVALEAMQ